MSVCMMDDSPWCSPGTCTDCDAARRPPKDEVAELKEKLAAAEARVKEMSGAASSAASTTVTALERIQAMEKVVEAAVAWARGGSHARLTEEVNAWLDYKRTWS